jgi:hypothetical protein
MNVIKATRIAQDEIVAILKRAKLTDGSLLDDDEIKKKSKRVMFWYRQAPLSASNKEILVIWAIPSIDVIGHADNRTAIRSVYASIDIYSKNGELDEDTLNVIDKIATECESQGWRFEKVALDSIDYVDGLTQLRYSATKKI